NPAIKKENLLKLALSGKNKPVKKSVDGQALYDYTSENSPSFDSKFKHDINKIRPDCFRTRSQKAFDKMMKVIPQELVKYHTSQKGRGAKNKHRYIHQKYGRFSASPTELMATACRKGLSGHPARGRKFRQGLLQKTVINL